MSSVEHRGSQTVSAHNSDSEQQGLNEVEYEYMDIRGNEKDGSPSAHTPLLSPRLTMDREGLDEEGLDEEEEEEDEYVEDSNYHYTNRQPKLRQALQDMKTVKVQAGDDGLSYEYEDMDSLATQRQQDAAVYQNVQGGGEGSAGAAPAHRSGFETYVKVRAGVGVGETAAGDRSFDNPDYWHSRMFLKPKAVPT